MDPNFASLVGMITGIIGAITGTLGAITGLISYRRSDRVKALELRLELRRDVSDFHANISRVRELIDQANRSRRNVNAARGMAHSGQMKKWEIQVKEDRSLLSQLSMNFQPEPEYNMMNEKELESGLINIHRLQGQIKSLRDKYLENLRSDDEKRKEIREDERAFNPPPPPPR